MQASRQSVKAHQSFGSIGFSLSTGFQVYLSNCWDPYVSPGCTIRLVFFCSFSAFFQHFDLVTTSLRAAFQVYLSQAWVLCMQTKAVQYNLLGVESHLWVLCFVLVNFLGRWNQYMWLVSCRRQGIVTQGPAPDPKCKLSISSFLILPHLFRLPHLLQEFCVGCIVIMNDRGMGQALVG